MIVYSQGSSRSISSATITSSSSPTWSRSLSFVEESLEESFYRWIRGIGHPNHAFSCSKTGSYMGRRRTYAPLACFRLVCCFRLRRKINQSISCIRVRGVSNVPYHPMDGNGSLWDVLRETFVSSWHFEVSFFFSLPDPYNFFLFKEQKVSRQAVTYTKNPSKGYMEYVVSALSICSFIGDLFRYNFITRPDTVGCIRVLMYNLTTVEHITAIHNIIQHAGIFLWREAQDLDAEIWEFRKVLLENPNRWRIIGLCCYNRFKLMVMREWDRELMIFLIKWRIVVSLWGRLDRLSKKCL